VAGKGAVLAIRIVSDASGAAKGFSEAESKVAKFQGGMDKASVAAAGVLAGVGAVAKAAYDSASALQQSSGAVESVFGAQAKAVQDLASKAADAVGLSANAYQELGSVLGAQLKGMGYAGAGLVKQTDALIGTGADLAATFGGTTSEAVSALSSLLRGERDPIERYGIAISQAAVDAKVAALGLDTSTEAGKRAAAAQATLALVAEQSASSQGMFAKEADSAAGSTQIASAKFEDAKAALGDVLLPVVSQGMTMLAALAGWFQRNSAVVLPLVGAVAGLAGVVLVVNGAFRAYQAIARAATIAQIAFNLAMSLNPIMLVVIAVAAVIAALVLAYNKFEWFRNLVKGIANAVMGYIGLWVDAIQWVLDKLSFVGDAFSAVGGLFSGPAQATVALTPVAAGSAAGLFGSAGVAGGGPVPSLYGAPMTALAGGRSTAGQGAGNTVNVTINGALDPVATGRQVVKVLRDYAQATGGQVSVTVGRGR
jgi:hypothetical protein